MTNACETCMNSQPTVLFVLLSFEWKTNQCMWKSSGDNPRLINISPTISLGVIQSHHHGNELTLTSLRSVNYSAGASNAQTYSKVWWVINYRGLTSSAMQQTDEVLSAPLPVLNWQRVNWMLIWTVILKCYMFFNLRRREKNNLSSAEFNLYLCFHDHLHGITIAHCKNHHKSSS